MAMGKQHRLRVSPADARAISRALRAELPIEVFPERMTCLYFDREGFPLLHRARHTPEDVLHVRALVGACAPERAVLEVQETRGEAIELQKVEIPREALRKALRTHATSELLPSLPTGLVPSLRITFLRERYARKEWQVHLDRELAYRSEGCPPLREQDAIVTLTWFEHRPPKWLSLLAEGFARYDAYAEGMSRLEQAPGAPRLFARPRPGDWSDALEA